MTKEALKPKQERFLVATIGNWGRVEWADGVFPSLGDKMYSASSHRTWVGLTKKEFQEAVEGLEDLEDCWVAIEAALRSKND